MTWRKRKPLDFQAEIDAHLALEADALRAEGQADPEAAARRAYGNRTAAEERFYESGRWMPLDHLLRDLRFATRVLMKDLRFSTLAVLGLALGIGVSTAIFALANASYQAGMAAPPGYTRVFRVVDGLPGGDFSYSEYRAFQDQAKSFRSFDAESGHERFILSPLAAGSEPEEVEGRFVDGAAVVLGRGFSREEAQNGTPPVAILDFRFWKRRFGADPGVVGRTVILNAHALTIVGVGDAGRNTSDFYLPPGVQPLLLANRGNWLQDPAAQWLMVGATLRPGVSTKQAQAEMDVLARALHSANPARQDRVLVSPGAANPRKRRQLLALVAAIAVAVSMILLIACSNLANLLLARAVVRRREIAVRLSLGAGRARLVAQLLTESLLLALAGGALGILFSSWLARALVLLANAGPGLPFEPHLDPAAVLYGVVLSVATGLSFGLAPALSATKTNLAASLHGQALAGHGTSQRIWSPRNLLVIVPLAVSLMLLLAAGVAVRSVQRGYVDGPSFEAAHLIGMSFQLSLQGYDEARTRAFQENLRVRAASMPGVTSVAMATALPVSNASGSFRFAVEGAAPVTADYNSITPGFFETVGAPVARGRAFTAADREGSQPVALVNQDFARRRWPGEEPIGKRLRLATGSAYFEVVGVAPDLEQSDSQFNSVRPTVYVPYTQSGLFLRGAHPHSPPYEMQFLVRAGGDPAPLKAALRQEAHAADPSLRVTVETIEERLEAQLGPVKTISMLLSALGGLALIMASIGIYAILAYAVSQRTREIGIRMALGAHRREILAIVMQRTAVLIAWGIALGLAGALALSRIVTGSLGPMGQLDAPTCVAVSLLLSTVALLASYLPARKAFRVDPAQSLRSE
jgi:predicted permease